LPTEYAVTAGSQYGIAGMLSRVERGLARGVKLLQVREPDLGDSERELFTRKVVELAHRYGCKVLTKSPFAGADGIHFTASGLMRLQKKPESGLAAASCHTREELEQAMRLELDFAVLGPIRDKSPALGWERFAELAHGTTIPLYAIGGLTRADLEDAWRAGAHGVAMIRGSWS
jgi:8-oxo-dGTP diphosphatase